MLFGELDADKKVFPAGGKVSDVEPLGEDVDFGGEAGGKEEEGREEDRSNHFSGKICN